MSRFLILALIVAIFVVANAIPTILPEDETTPAITDKMISFINNAGTTWKAAIPAKFQNATVAHVKKLLGTRLIGESGYVPVENVKSTFKTAPSAIPESFDVRTGFPQCANIVGHVRDQSSCGSCWAFGSTEAFNDRYCISTGDAKTLMAPEDTLACCTGPVCSFSMGCNGGQPAGAWNWFTKQGVSTGGDYADIGTGSTCKPYSLPSCAHHVSPPPGMVACDTLPEYRPPSARHLAMRAATVLLTPKTSTSPALPMLSEAWRTFKWNSWRRAPCLSP